MSVVNSRSGPADVDDLHQLADPHDGHCWYCGLPLAEVAVLVDGIAAAILLHASCAAELAQMLTVDSWRANSIAACKAIDRGIVPSLKPAPRQRR